MRPLVLIVAGASKLVFIGHVLVHGRLLPGYQAGIPVTIDVIQVLLFAGYLLATARRGSAT